ncbi:Neuronal growth regulator 1 [Orchesella cincta]|uniref:Neuronal growth regulator 1 n=1 Tax=Orchesella cincta TaxID=48709 RepID=A0A1D2MVN7_ORCCI|nr:Neuronal growth regulator 1 [Orchesella cincta]
MPVSWVRRKSDQLELLTLGTKNHSSDPRFLSDFKYPNNWRLGIRNISRNDSGTYLCQISTHPPKVLEVQLTVECMSTTIFNSLDYFELVY